MRCNRASWQIQTQICSCRENRTTSVLWQKLRKARWPRSCVPYSSRAGWLVVETTCHVRGKIVFDGWRKVEGLGVGQSRLSRVNVIALRPEVQALSMKPTQQQAKLFKFWAPNSSFQGKEAIVPGIDSKRLLWLSRWGIHDARRQTNHMLIISRLPQDDNVYKMNRGPSSFDNFALTEQ